MRRARRSKLSSWRRPPSAKDQIDRVEEIAEAVESPTFSVQFGPNGPQWCSDELLAAIGRRSRQTGRRVHMHLLETQYQRAFADRAYPEGVVKRLEALGLLSSRLTLAHCVYARVTELDAIAASGAVIATNPSSNLHLASGVAPIAEAMRRGCRVALGVDASAFDEDDDILREMRLGHFLHGGWGYDSVIQRGQFLAAIVAAGRFANGVPGDGELRVGASADILVLDLDRLDRDAIMPVEPIDLVFARAHAAHVSELMIGGVDVVRDGKLARVDLAATEDALRASYRENMPSRDGYLDAWTSLEPASRRPLSQRDRLLLSNREPAIAWSARRSIPPETILTQTLPVIDVSALDDERALPRLAAEIGAACRDVGFFYVTNHSVPQSLMETAVRPVAPAVCVAARREAADRHGGGWGQSRLFRADA